nr:oligosaccharide flippase family protein [Defluviimonas salinarum]
MAFIERLRARGLASKGFSTSSAGAFAVLVGGAGVSYLAQVATARLVGVDSFGIYMYAVSWLLVASTLSTLGFHVSLLRLLSAYRAEGNWAAMRGVIRFTALIVAVASVLVALLGMALTLSTGAEPELRVTLLIALVATPLFALQLVGASIVRAFGSVVAALAPLRLGRDSFAIVLLAGLVGFGFAPATAPTAMAAMSASGGLILAIAIVQVRRKRPAELDGVSPHSALRDWMRPALPLTVIMGADVVMARSGIIVLGLLGDARGAGIFAVAFSLSILIALPRMAVAAAFAPTVASLHAQGDHDGLQALTRRAARLTLAGAACIAVPMLIAMPMLLGFFGPGFAEGAPAAAVLVAGQLVAAAAGPQQHLMTMTGRETAGAAMHSGGALIGLVLCFLLAGPFGILGAAVAISTGVVAWNVAMAWFAFTRLGLRPGLFVARAAPSQI